MWSGTAPHLAPAGCLVTEHRLEHMLEHMLEQPALTLVTEHRLDHMLEHMLEQPALALGDWPPPSSHAAPPPV